MRLEGTLISSKRTHYQDMMSTHKACELKLVHMLPFTFAHGPSTFTVFSTMKSVLPSPQVEGPTASLMQHGMDAYFRELLPPEPWWCIWCFTQHATIPRRADIQTRDRKRIVIETDMPGW